MKGGARKKESYVSIVIVVAIVLLATVAIVLRADPERMRVVSTDGMVQVVGMTRSTGVVEVHRLDDVATSIAYVVSPVYEINLTQAGALKEGEVQFLYDQFEGGDIAIQDAVVYTFDRATLTWKPLPTLFQLSDHTLSAIGEFSGSTMVVVGEREDNE